MIRLASAADLDLQDQSHPGSAGQILQSCPEVCALILPDWQSWFAGAASVD